MTSTKAERKLERRRAEDEQERRVAVTTPRHIHDDWGYRGIGACLLQLIRRPSFERTVCYEVRGQEGSLRLYRALSIAPGEAFVVGGSLVAIEPIVLGRLVRSIDALSVPVRTRLLPLGVFDGETYELATLGGVQAAARFSWRGGHVPEGWMSMANLVESTIRDFDALDTIRED
jgi:hypothetical protein